MEDAYNNDLLTDYPHLPLVPTVRGNDKDSYMDLEFCFYEDSAQGKQCCLWTPVYAWNEDGDLFGPSHAPEGTISTLSKKKCPLN